MSFSLHFTIDAELDRSLISAKIYGTWKKETAQEYHDEFKKVAEPLLGKKWARVINLSNWKVSYPEIVKIIGDHMRWANQNGNVLAIYIIDDPVKRNQLKKMLSAGGIGSISKTVRTPEEAEKILAENGF